MKYHNPNINFAPLNLNQNTQPERISNKVINLQELSVFRLPLSYNANFTI